MSTITVSLVIEVDDNAWADLYGRGDAYGRAEAQRRRSLVADVEDYVFAQVAESAAANEGAILSVEQCDLGELAEKTTQ